MYNWEYDFSGDFESIDLNNVTTVVNLEEQFVQLDMIDEYGNSYVSSCNVHLCMPLLKYVHLIQVYLYLGQCK